MPARYRPSTAILATIALALTMAASAATAQSPQPGDTPDPGITDGSLKRELDSARQKWKSAHIKSYQVRVALSCFCPEQIRRPRTLTVRGGAPVKPPSHLRAVASVTRMFQLIEGAIDDGVASLGVTYGAHGVPRSINIDTSRQIADEEEYYKIDRFKRLR